MAKSLAVKNLLATTECGVNFQLLAVIYWSSPMGNSLLQSTITSYGQFQQRRQIHPINWSHPPPSWAVPPERLVHSINRCSSATAGIRPCNLATFSMRGNHLTYATTQYSSSLSSVSPVSSVSTFASEVRCVCPAPLKLCYVVFPLT